MCKPNVVTRFLKERAFINNKYIDPCAFYRCPQDLEDQELSVFNIDEELKSNDNKAIYEIANTNKLFNIGGRADLKVVEIEAIRSRENLKVSYNKNNKHCAIRPFPNDKQEALIVAQKLVRIAKPHIKNINL